MSNDWEEYKQREAYFNQLADQQREEEEYQMRVQEYIAQLESEKAALEKKFARAVDTVVYYARMQNKAINKPVTLMNFNKAVLCCHDLGIDYNAHIEHGVERTTHD